MLQSAYKKIEGLLPIPSYKQILYSNFKENTIIIIYEIEHNLKTPIQYQWLSDIKIIWKKNIIVEFEYVSEFYINELTIQSGVKYSLQELSNTFDSEFIKYPKPFYPATKKELYKKLVWYANKLNKKELLTIEMMYATAKRMNKKLDDKYQDKELFKKSYQAYMFTKENQQIKTKKEVRLIRKRNGVNRGKQISKEFQARVQKVKKIMPLHVKPNGKPNVTAIGKELKISRVTITKILKFITMTLFIFWIKSSLFLFDGEVVAKGYTIIPSATFTLFSKYYKKEVSKRYIFSKV